MRIDRSHKLKRLLNRSPDFARMIKASLLAIVLLVCHVFVVTAQANEVSLTDLQRKASIEALNAIIKETGADPLEIIRLGLEQFKKGQHKITDTEKPALNKSVDVSQNTKQTSISPEEEDHDLGLKFLFAENEPRKRESRDNIDHDQLDFGLKALFKERADRKNVDENEDYGLESMFNEETSPKSSNNVQSFPNGHPDKRDDEDDDVYDDEDFGLRSLFQEKTIAAAPTSSNKSEQTRDIDHEDFGLKRLFSENESEKISQNSIDNGPTGNDSRKNPMDDEVDYSLGSLFNETPKPTSGGEDFIRSSGTSETKPAAYLSIDRSESSTGGHFGNVVAVERSDKDQSQGVGDLQLASLWREDEHEQAQKQDQPAQESNSTHKPEPSVATAKKTQESKGLPATPISGDKVDNNESNQQEHEQQKPTNQPREENFVDSYIDESDPNDPKKVHVERHIKSHVDPSTGTVSRVHAENHSSSSLNNGNNPSKQHQSKHSSHTTTSYSSTSNGPQGKNNNLKNKNKPMQMPALPSIPQMPISPLPPIVLMPMVPYGAHPASWPAFYNPSQNLSKKQQKRQQQPPFAAGAFASAQAGSFPGATAAYAGPAVPYYGVAAGFPNPAEMARIEAKRAQRRANKAKRRQMATVQQH